MIGRETRRRQNSVKIFSRPSVSWSGDGSSISMSNLLTTLELDIEGGASNTNWKTHGVGEFPVLGFQMFKKNNT